MKIEKRFVWALIMVFGLFIMACDDDVTAGGGDDDDEEEIDLIGIDSYVLAANSSEAAYLIQPTSIESGGTTIKYNGLETETATIWLYHPNQLYLYRLVYNQGNPGIGSSYMLDESGEITQRNITFESPRFTTYGPFDKYFITASALSTDTKYDDDTYAQGVVFTKINTKAQTYESTTIVTEDFLGNGEYVTFSGIQELNGKLFTGVVPLGISAYGTATGKGETTSDIKDPDRCWIAIFDDVDDFSSYKIIEDDRIGYASSRFRSQYYTNLVMGADGNLYVFSSGYDSNSTKPSGVIRLNPSTETFDNYYFDIQTAAGGVSQLFKVWPIANNYFLLQMYATDDHDTSAQYKLAIFNAAGNGSFAWVSGLPGIDEIGSYGATPYVENNNCYVSITLVTDNEEEEVEAYIYKINPATAVASKGLEVGAAVSIPAIGKLIR